MLAAASLELKAEKQNAHAQKYGESIKAVQFSPDGSTIVSCGVDQTIKIWDAVNFRPFLDTEWEEVGEGAMMEELGRAASIKHWRNTITGERLKVKPSGGKRLTLELPRPKSGMQVP